MKKLLALILCLTMVLSTMSFAAFAEETEVLEAAAVKSTIGYTSANSIYGEEGAPAKESFVIKVYSDDTLIGTTSLVNIDGIIDGDVYVTWNLYTGAHNDSYWNCVWAEGHPNAAYAPTRMELYADGDLYAEGPVQLNGPDNLWPVNWNEVNNVRTYVSTYEELIEALEEENANVVMLNDITATATQDSGYGAAGIVLDANDTLDGNGYTLTINGANSTWDCAVNTKGGTLKNITVAGAFRGVFTGGTNADIILDNVIFKNVVYTFNSDDGNKNYSVTIKNSTINGWTSFSNCHKSVTFENCTFGEGSGNAFCRPYQPTTFVDCKFEADYALDAVRTTGLVFENCTYAGKALNADTAAAMFYAGGTVTIDGKATTFGAFTPVAQVGEIKYASLQAAINAAEAGDTITLLSDITISEKWDCRNAKIDVPVTIDGNGKTIKFTNVVNDGFNHLAAFRVEADATFKNLTIDMSEAISEFAGRFRAISSSADLVVDNCNFIGSTEYTNTRAIIYGEGSGAAIGNVDVTVTNSTFTNWRRGVSDNEAATDANSVIISDSEFNNSSIHVSASYAVALSGNKIDGGYVNITSYTPDSDLAVIVEDTVLDADYADYNKISNAAILDVPAADDDSENGFIAPDVVADLGTNTSTDPVSYTSAQKAVEAAIDIATETQAPVTVTVKADIPTKLVFGSPVSTFSLNNAADLVTVDLGGYVAEQGVEVNSGNVKLINGTIEDSIVVNGGGLVLENVTVDATLTVNAGTVEIISGSYSFDPTAYVVAGKKAIVDTYGWYTIVDAATKDNSIAVVFEEVNTVEGEDIYNINVVNADGINRLNSADLTFEFVPVAVDGGAMVYEILEKEGSKISVSQHPTDADRYLFNYDTKEGVVDTDDSITIGQVKVTGYGKFTLAIVDDTNEVHATTVNDNVVDSYVTTGEAGKGTLVLPTAPLAGEIKVPTRTLTIQIAFPNAIKGNVTTYQDMKVTIEGNFGGVEATKTYELGALDTNNGYVVTEDELVLNNAYNVTVSGAGYRTARYTVTMTEAKTLNFWNNVKTTPEVIEVGKTTGAVAVTFLAGDIVKDNSINIYDLSAVVSYFGTNNDTSAYSKYAKYDLNRDGKIDSKDVAYVLVSWEK